MVILDRQVDMVTPLCTQLTYEGLIDEIIGIKNSFVEVDPALTNPVPPTPSSSSAPQFGALSGPPKKKKHLLSTIGNAASSSSSSSSQVQPAQQQQQGQNNTPPGGDPLFGELRDKNFTIVGALLNRVAKRINMDYEQRHSAQTVSQMRDFVGRLSGLQAEHQALRLREFTFPSPSALLLALSVRVYWDWELIPFGCYCRYWSYGADHDSHYFR